jgi:hypothetical protein
MNFPLLSRFDRWYFGPVPIERLAFLRIATGVYAVIYLISRAAHLNAAARYPATSFAPVGVVSVLSAPLPAFAVYGLWAVAVLGAVAFSLGFWYRVAAPVFALSLLWVLSYRHSFGMIFHTDNLLVIHVLLLAVSRAGEAHAVGRARTGSPASEEACSGWVIRASCLVTVASYLVAGIAKLKVGGLAWAGGDTLREQIAYDALRKMELGSVYSPLGIWLLPHAGVFPPLAAFSLATELLGPVALLGRRWAAVWCLAAWSFHAGVLLMMAIVFPYPLSTVAFLGFFPLERIVERVRRVTSRRPLGPHGALAER